MNRYRFLTKFPAFLGYWAVFVSVTISFSMELPAQLAEASQPSEVIGEALIAEAEKALFDVEQSGLNMAQAFKLFEEAKYHFESSKNHFQLTNIYLGQGYIRTFQFDYGEASHFFLKSIQHANLSQDSMLVAESKYRLAEVLTELERCDSAQQLCMESLAMLDEKAIQRGPVLSLLGSIQSICYKDTLKSRSFYLAADRIYREAGSEASLPSLYSSLSFNYLKTGDVDSAAHYVSLGLEILKDHPNEYIKATILKRRAAVLLAQGKPNLCLDHVDSVLSWATENSQESLFTYTLREGILCANASGKTDLVGMYTDSLIHHLTQTIIISQEKARKAATNQFKIELAQERANREIAENLQKRQLLFYQMGIMILFFLILVGFLAFFTYKSRVAHRLAQNRLHFITGEKGMLIQQLQAKESELSSVVSDSSHYIAVLLKIKQTVDSSEGASKKAVEKVRVVLQQNAHLLRDLEAKKAEFQGLTEDFYHRLKTMFPDITQGEFQIASLVLTGRSSKEIASMRNISPRTVDNARARLRKKMGLKRGDALVDALRGQ